jgi:hypothetical protein
MNVTGQTFLRFTIPYRFKTILKKILHFLEILRNGHETKESLERF